MNKLKGVLKKALGFFIVFLFLVNYVYAQIAARESAFDYSLFSGEFYSLKEGEEKIDFKFYNGTYRICSNGGKTIPILVVNQGDAVNKYSLEALGAGWLKLNVNEFSLPKKQNGVVFLELEPGQDAGGKYSIKINAMSSVGNLKKDLSLDIHVENCYSVDLELEKENDKVCGGTKQQYKGEIINRGKERNGVELTIKGPNWISANKNEFSIDANEKQNFELNADVPANAKGSFDVLVSAAVENFPSIKPEKKLSIEAVPKYDCYKGDIIADETIKNYYSGEYAPIKIRNSGIKQASYGINLNAPDWILIEPKNLTVNPGQIGNINININPSADIPEGIYAIKISAGFEDAVYSKSVNIALKKSKLKSLKFYFAFYQFYIYTALFILIILLIFRRKIADKVRASYRNHRIRKARLRALKKARAARKKK